MGNVLLRLTVVKRFLLVLGAWFVVADAGSIILKVSELATGRRTTIVFAVFASLALSYRTGKLNSPVRLLPLRLCRSLLEVVAKQGVVGATVTQVSSASAKLAT